MAKSVSSLACGAFLLLCIGPASPRSPNECNVVISEISPKTPASGLPLFIELEKVCPPNKERKTEKLDTYAIVLVDIKTASVTTFCRLIGKFSEVKVSSKRHLFYVVGDSPQSNLNIRGETCTVATGWEAIPYGSDLGTLAILLFNKRTHFFDMLRPIPNTERTPALKLDFVSYNKLKSAHIQDWVLYGSSVPKTIPALLNTLGMECDRINNCFARFRRVDNNRDGMSRCTDSALPKTPQAFYSAPVTPLGVNDCTHKTALFEETTTRQPHHQQDHSSPEASSEAESARALEASRTQPLEVVTVHPDSGKHIWSTCALFPEQDKKLIITHQSNLLDINVILNNDVCSWFSYIRNEDVPNQSRFRCKFCNQILNSGIVVDRRKSPYVTLMTKNKGHLSGRKSKNSAAIVKHRDSNKIHQIALQYFKALDRGEADDQLAKTMRAPNGELMSFYNATMNAILIAYKATHMRLPFASFPELMQLFAYHGVDIGLHHHSRYGMKNIVTSMASVMKAQLISYLQTNNLHVAILVDTSVDISGADVLNIELHYVDVDLRVQNFFYGLVTVKVEKAGEDLLDLIKERFQQDGTLEYFQKHIISIVTDGASVMRFRLVSAVDNWALNQIVGIHCSNHKFELAFSKGLSKFPFIVLLDGFYNHLFNFYRNSAKVMSHLKEFQELDKVKFSLHNLYKIRWVSNRVRVSKPILRYWVTLANELEGLQSDDRFTENKSQLEKAKDIRKKLLKRSYILHIAFFADVGEIFKEASLKAQAGGATYCNLHRLNSNIVKQLQLLAEADGENLKAVQDASTCDEERIQKCTVQEFETSDVVNFHGKQLPEKVLATEEKLSSNRKEYIASILAEMDKYFTERPNDLKSSDMSLLDPQLLPKFGDWIDELPQKLSRLNNVFHWVRSNSITTLVNDYTVLIESIVTHSKFAAHSVLPLEQFWQAFSQINDVEWTQLSRIFVRNCLSIPLSNAASERVFSLYNREKTPQRYSLDVETVESLLRIQDNKIPIEEFDALYFAKKFVASHSRSDDETVPVEQDRSKPVQRHTTMKTPPF